MGRIRKNIKKKTKTVIKKKKPTDKKDEEFEQTSNTSLTTKNGNEISENNPKNAKQTSTIKINNIRRKIEKNSDKKDIKKYIKKDIVKDIKKDIKKDIVKGIKKDIVKDIKKDIVKNIIKEDQSNGNQKIKKQVESKQLKIDPAEQIGQDQISEQQPELNNSEHFQKTQFEQTEQYQKEKSKYDPLNRADHFQKEQAKKEQAKKEQAKKPQKKQLKSNFYNKSEHSQEEQSRSHQLDQVEIFKNIKNSSSDQTQEIEEVMRENKKQTIDDDSKKQTIDDKFKNVKTPLKTDDKKFNNLNFKDDIKSPIPTITGRIKKHFSTFYTRMSHFLHPYFSRNEIYPATESILRYRRYLKRYTIVSVDDSHTIFQKRDCQVVFVPITKRQLRKKKISFDQSKKSNKLSLSVQLEPQYDHSSELSQTDKHHYPDLSARIINYSDLMARGAILPWNDYASRALRVKRLFTDYQTFKSFILLEHHKLFMNHSVYYHQLYKTKNTVTMRKTDVKRIHMHRANTGYGLFQDYSSESQSESQFSTQCRKKKGHSCNEFNKEKDSDVNQSIENSSQNSTDHGSNQIQNKRKRVDNSSSESSIGVKTYSHYKKDQISPLFHQFKNEHLHIRDKINKLLKERINKMNPHILRIQDKNKENLSKKQRATSTRIYTQDHSKVKVLNPNNESELRGYFDGHDPNSEQIGFKPYFEGIGANYPDSKKENLDTNSNENDQYTSIDPLNCISCYELLVKDSLYNEIQSKLRQRLSVIKHALYCDTPDSIRRRDIHMLEDNELLKIFEQGIMDKISVLGCGHHQEINSLSERIKCFDWDSLSKLDSDSQKDKIEAHQKDELKVSQEAHQKDKPRASQSSVPSSSIKNCPSKLYSQKQVSQIKKRKSTKETIKKRKSSKQRRNLKACLSSENNFTSPQSPNILEQPKAQNSLKMIYCNGTINGLYKNADKVSVRRRAAYDLILRNKLWVFDEGNRLIRESVNNRNTFQYKYDGNKVLQEAVPDCIDTCPFALPAYLLIREYGWPYNPTVAHLENVDYVHECGCVSSIKDKSHMSQEWVKGKEIYGSNSDHHGLNRIGQLPFEDKQNDCLSANDSKGIYSNIHKEDNLIINQNNSKEISSPIESIRSQIKSIGSPIKSIGSQVESIGSQVESIGSQIESIGSQIENGSVLNYPKTEGYLFSNRTKEDIEKLRRENAHLEMVLEKMKQNQTLKKQEVQSTFPIDNEHGKGFSLREQRTKKVIVESVSDENGIQEQMGDATLQGEKFLVGNWGQIKTKEQNEFLSVSKGQKGKMKKDKQGDEFLSVSMRQQEKLKEDRQGDEESIISDTSHDASENNSIIDNTSPLQEVPAKDNHSESNNPRIKQNILDFGNSTIADTDKIFPGLFNLDTVQFKQKESSNEKVIKTNQEPQQHIDDLTTSQSFNAFGSHFQMDNQPQYDSVQDTQSHLGVNQQNYLQPSYDTYQKDSTSNTQLFNTESYRSPFQNNVLQMGVELQSGLNKQYGQRNEQDLGKFTGFSLGVTGEQKGLFGLGESGLFNVREPTENPNLFTMNQSDVVTDPFIGSALKQPSLFGLTSTTQNMPGFNDTKETQEKQNKPSALDSLFGAGTEWATFDQNKKN